ncbi:MAG: nitroreductase family protein [Anaerolineae bacterium]|nr:nitroreductase family protein [Anaerolineae bacterium]
MTFSKPITEIIKARYSCRTYQDTPIDTELQQQLNNFLAASQTGPLGTVTRLTLISAIAEDTSALKGVGTYGFIKNPTGFITGTASTGEKNLEDLGYMLERAVLFTTDLGLGTCWLGGSFTKSRFAKKLGLHKDEHLPAVIATGYIAGTQRQLDMFIRRSADSDNRKPWKELFFEGDLTAPLSQDTAGDYIAPLEMLRLAPSASNKQPWRIVKDGEVWHFYLQRTPGYGKGILGLVKLEDLQRVDIGIAMCHFALTAQELDLQGHWEVNEPGIKTEGMLTEYVVSWCS